MNNQDFYQQWIAHRRRQTVPQDFSRRVMAALLTAALKPGTGLRHRRQGFALALAQWTGAFFLVLAGLFRISYVTVCLLVP